MDEESIRFYAHVQAVVGEMKALEIGVQGMIADNAEREHRGEAPAWTGDMFRQAESDMLSLVNVLRRIVNAT